MLDEKIKIQNAMKSILNPDQYEKWKKIEKQKERKKESITNEKRKKIVQLFLQTTSKSKLNVWIFFILALSFLQIYCESKEFLNQKQQMQKLEYCSKHHLQKMTF